LWRWQVAGYQCKYKYDSQQGGKEKDALSSLHTISIKDEPNFDPLAYSDSPNYSFNPRRRSSTIERLVGFSNGFHPN
jgi:hypothetical protein